MASAWLAPLDVNVFEYLPLALPFLQGKHVTNGFYRVILGLLRHGGHGRVHTNLADAVPTATDMPVNLAHKPGVGVGATGELAIGATASAGHHLQQPGDQHQRQSGPDY
jgi:hypothetical protein